MFFFVKTGCTRCHSGKLLRANSYQKLGVTAGYWTYTKSKPCDERSFKETTEPWENYLFKMLILRDISGTFPYFYKGSAEKLDVAVWIMAKVQLEDLSRGSLHR